MGDWVRRRTLLENDTSAVVEIREYLAGAPADEYVLAVRLRGGEVKEIRATKFHDHCVDSGRSRTIRVVRNDVYSGLHLAPHVFIFNTRIIFRVNDHGLLHVVAVASDQGLMTELRRIKFVARFLRPEASAAAAPIELERGHDDHDEENLLQLQSTVHD